MAVTESALRIAILAPAEALSAWLEEDPRASAPTVPVDTLADHAEIPPERFRASAARGIPFCPAEVLPLDEGALGLLSPAKARELRAVPLCATGAAALVALSDPTDEEALALLGFLLSRRIVPVLTAPSAIERALAAYDRREDEAILNKLGLSPRGEAESAVSAASMERLAAEKPVVALVQEILQKAIARRASDIHLRPTAEGAVLLYRIDGELLLVRSFLPGLVPAVVSRIKVIAGMDLAEHRRPQDGRATFVAPDGRPVDLRVSLLPTVHGESLAIRLLDRTAGVRRLPEIGFSSEEVARLEGLLARGHGLVLVTGPTGCGKTTTLYAMLLALIERRIAILTIEDPVEYRIAGIEQMQVNRAVGFTFASALRNVLRHDPDAIMVGEIRDRETAAIAVESALTGHLVLSTLHANTAASAVTRLLDLGVEPFMVRATLLAAIAQRLVRLNCRHCLAPEAVPPWMREGFALSAEEPFFRARGCRACEGLGLAGRTAVYELLEISPAVRGLIQPAVDADRLLAAARAAGMRTLGEHALSLARAARIPLAEAWRVHYD
jgi:type II secretory ATPase GspE/PulE/Tfp pilus assembly ATPase PilB-like protein